MEALKLVKQPEEYSSYKIWHNGLKKLSGTG